MMNNETLTGGIFYCRDSAVFSVSASNKLLCNLTDLCFEIGNKNIPPNRYASAYIDTQNDYFETKEYEKSEYHYYDFNCICKLQFDK